MVENKSARRRGRPPAFDEAAALDAAMRAFWRNGYDGADLEAISAAVGATKPSLYRRFGDKRALFLRALQHYGESIGAAPLRAFLAQDAPAAAAQSFLRAAIENATREDAPRGCFIACVASEAAETMGEARTFCAQAHRIGTETIAERLRAFQHDGALPAALDPLISARALVDFMQGAALRARAGAPRAELVETVAPLAALALCANAAGTVPSRT